MKYLNHEKTSVQATVGGRIVVVPRGHYLWTEIGIDIAEESGSIEDADETFSGLGGADNPIN